MFSLAGNETHTCYSQADEWKLESNITVMRLLLVFTMPVFCVDSVRVAVRMLVLLFVLLF